MKIKLEKILNPWSLLALNALIIVVTELSGDIFEQTGIIHLIAILFVIMGISRIFVHYNVYDRYLKLLIKGSVLALIIFSVSHLIEFIGVLLLKDQSQAIFVNVVNFYIMSMLMVAIGAEYFLRATKQKSYNVIIWLVSGIAVFFCLTLLTFFMKIPVSLQPDGWQIYIYTIAVLVAYFLSVSRLLKINKIVSIMRGFTNYYIGAFSLVGIAALEYVWSVVLGYIGFPLLQTIYTSHFLFYGALSLMFLAFDQLSSLGGMYSEIKE